MQWLMLIALVILVIVIAYALGVYFRNRQGDLPTAAPRPAAAKPQPRKAAGGDREVRVVVAWLLSQAFEQTGIKVADDKIAYQRIVEAADKAVSDLKTQDTVTISLPYLTADASGPKHLEARITREMIAELVKY